MNCRAMLAAALVSVALPVLSGCMDRPVDDADRVFVVTIADLQPNGPQLPDDYARYERFGKGMWMDGTVVIEYEFDPPAEADLPYLSSMAARHPNQGEACLSYRSGNLGVSFGGSELDRHDEIYATRSTSTATPVCFRCFAMTQA